MTEEIGGALQKLIRRCKSGCRLKIARVPELADGQGLKPCGDLISVRVQVSPRALESPRPNGRGLVLNLIFIIYDRRFLAFEDFKIGAFGAEVFGFPVVGKPNVKMIVSFFPAHPVFNHKYLISIELGKADFCSKRK